MTSFRFDFEWIEAGPSADVLCQSTMARLQILLDGEPITRVANQRSSSVTNSITVPLFPLAEWLAANWWPLFHEVSPSDDDDVREGFGARHDVSAAGDGFALPRVRLASVGDRIDIRAVRWKPEYCNVEFLADGHAIVERDEAENQCRRVIDSVIERLRDSGIENTWLEAEWGAINDLSEEEREFCRASSLLGLDPFAVPAGVSKDIIRRWDSLEASLREDMFTCASSDTLEALSEWVSQTTNRLSATVVGSEWPSLQAQLRSQTVEPPWQRGYRLASEARAAMGVRHPRFDFSESGGWAVQSISISPPTPLIQGVVRDHGPSCAIRARNETARRFLIARSIGDYLSRPNGSATLLTSAQSSRQAVSRAFAAELLAPAAFLRERLTARHGPIPLDRIEDVADELGVSSYAISHQILNHRIGRVASPE
jgi:hypothetical protein